LYNSLQAVQGYLAPPIFVVFFLGVFWKRLNAAGCLAALVVGFLLGAFRLAVDSPITLGIKTSYEPGSFLWIVNNIYFQYYSLVIFLVSVAAMVIVSHLTAPPDERQIQGLTYGTRTEQQKQESRASWSAIDIFTSGLVLAAILASYLYFTG
jgi:SSS family solute:Na+ symporter